MKKFSSISLLIVGMISAPLYAAEADHSNMHHEHAQHASQNEQQREQTQDHGMHHDQQTTPHGGHADHQPVANDQHQHHQDGHAAPKAAASSMPAATPVLPRLDALPPSGKSRENNFDHSHFMQNTALEQPLEVRCALASRGLIMLDNSSWEKCGGKPIGWSKGITAAQTSSDHSQHMNH
jgi:Ni/Co efflux regulator RcnB